MICPACYTLNEESSKFCKDCGISLTDGRVNREPPERRYSFLLLIYLGFLVLTRILYLVLVKWIQPTLITEDVHQLDKIYRMSDLIASSIELVLMGLMVLLFRGKARSIFIILLVVRAIVFAVYFFF